MIHNRFSTQFIIKPRRMTSKTIDSSFIFFFFSRQYRCWCWIYDFNIETIFRSMYVRRTGSLFFRRQNIWTCRLCGDCITNAISFTLIHHHTSISFCIDLCSAFESLFGSSTPSSLVSNTHSYVRCLFFFGHIA